MTKVYTDADYLSAHKQKKKIFWVFMLITLVYALGCGVFVWYHASLPYDESTFWAQFGVYALSVVYAVFAYVYLAIKFSRSRRYCKMLDNLNTGLKSVEKNFFFEFRRNVLQKDNVDAVSGIFGVWNTRKNEWQEREVYFDKEKPLPPFENGDYVRYITQGSVLIEYEIIQKQALEFSEVEVEE